MFHKKRYSQTFLILLFFPFRKRNKSAFQLIPSSYLIAMLYSILLSGLLTTLVYKTLNIDSYFHIIMVTLRTVNIKDLELLLKLDGKLHGTQKSTFTPNISGEPFKFSIDTYTGTSMNVREIQGVLKAVENGDFAFYPINTAMGFAVGFQIANPDTKEALLTFKESQLPKNYDFKKLSEYFMQPENMERAKSFGVSIVNNRDHYDY